MTEEPREPREAPRNPPTPAPPDLDPEQLRQYQEFQEFQRFQEFRRFQQSQGTALPPGSTPGLPPGPSSGSAPGLPPGVPPMAPPQAMPPQVMPPQIMSPQPTPPREPMWKVVLGSKLVRRLISLLIVLLIASYFYERFFGGEDPGDVAVDSGGDEGNVIAPQTPYGLQGTVALFYKHVGTGDAGRACLLFSEDGAKKAFADAFGAPDCEAAVRGAHDQVGNVSSYRMLGFPSTMRGTPTGGSVEVSSCALEVRDGPRLGRFVLTAQANKTWVITGYEAEPADCVTG